MALRRAICATRMPHAPPSWRLAPPRPMCQPSQASSLSRASREESGVTNSVRFYICTVRSSVRFFAPRTLALPWPSGAGGSELSVPQNIERARGSVTFSAPIGRYVCGRLFLQKRKVQKAQFDMPRKETKRATSRATLRNRCVGLPCRCTPCGSSSGLGQGAGGTARSGTWSEGRPSYRVRCTHRLAAHGRLRGGLG